MSGSQSKQPSGGFGARLALYGAAALVACILGVTLSLLVFGENEPQRRGGPFTLTDQTGAVATEEIFNDKVSLLYFGFTHCPDVCPTDLLHTVSIREKIREDGNDAQIVFVSVDHERDTPEEMALYVEAFGDDLIGLTGTAEQIATAAKAYEAVYKKSPLADPEDPESYSIIHSTYLYAVGKDGKEVWRFPSGTPPDVASRRLIDIGAFN